jgi:hypothetical protein
VAAVEVELFQAAWLAVLEEDLEKADPEAQVTRLLHHLLKEIMLVIANQANLVVAVVLAVRDQV